MCILEMKIEADLVNYVKTCSIDAGMKTLNRFLIAV